MRRVSFEDAFDRWYWLTEAERAHLDQERKRGGPILSWEALDHLCGLAVESGMKALMLKEKLEAADPTGDFPRSASTGRRPHVDELWEIFMRRCRAGRRASG